MKVVDFWKWQGYSQTKFSQRRLTTLGQSIASIEGMRDRDSLKKSILSRNFILGHLNRLLEEPFFLCIDYTGNLRQTCFCKTQFLHLKTASDTISSRVKTGLLCQWWESLTFIERTWKCSNAYVCKEKKSSNSKYRIKPLNNMCLIVHVTLRQQSSNRWKLPGKNLEERYNNKWSMTFHFNSYSSYDQSIEKVIWFHSMKKQRGSTIQSALTSIFFWNC